MTNRKRWAGGGILLAVFAALIWFGALFIPVVQGLDAGSKAPDFKTVTIDGKALELKNFKGKVVVLNFWATWCPPCRAEIPDFIEFAREYQKEAQVIGISLDNRGNVVDLLSKFVAQNKINYPVASDAEGKLAALYGNIRAIPTTFIIDGAGMIRHVQIGSMSKAELIGRVKPLLKK